MTQIQYSEISNYTWINIKKKEANIFKTFKKSLILSIWLQKYYGVVFLILFIYGGDFCCVGFSVAVVISVCVHWPASCFDHGFRKQCIQKVESKIGVSLLLGSAFNNCIRGLFSFSLTRHICVSVPADQPGTFCVMLSNEYIYCLFAKAKCTIFLEQNISCHITHHIQWV